VLSRRCAISQCEPALYAALLQYLHERNLDIRGITELSKGPATPILPLRARFYSFVFLKRRQYSATRLTKAHSLGASLIRARFNDHDGSTWTWCGVIEDLVELEYKGDRTTVAYMRWLAPWNGQLLDDWSA